MSELKSMDTVTLQIRRVQAFVDHQRGHKAMLADRAQVSRRNLTGCEDPNWYPNSRTLAKLIRALDELESEPSDTQEHAA